MPTVRRTSLIILLLFVASATLIVLPVSALPPRPTPTIIPASLTGGLITLTAVTETAVSPTTWTQIQWQDLQGNWHDVDGWRGTVDQNMQVTWWVGEDDLETGPFRWLAYAAEGSDEVLAISDPFTLPSIRQTTEVTIILP